MDHYVEVLFLGCRSVDGLARTRIFLVSATEFEAVRRVSMELEDGEASLDTTLKFREILGRDSVALDDDVRQVAIRRGVLVSLEHRE